MSTAATKVCNQCGKEFPKDGFAKKQWKKPNRSCRLCAEYTKISQEKFRTCLGCEVQLPRTEFDIYQWSKGNEARCHGCRDTYSKKVLESVNDPSTSKVKELPNGTMVCGAHGLECCDICMMDFTLPNSFALESRAKGRELTTGDYDRLTQKYQQDANIHINRKICILDGQAVCPRSSQKLRCPCNEVTYCSNACQKHHWKIHKMTCKHHAEQKRNKASQKTGPQAAASRAVDLTEDQKNVARKAAFLAERTREGSIDECAFQLGEHPLAIGGGSIVIGPDGEGFEKGDVAKIYRERLGAVWDGSPRYGMPPYQPRPNPVDWIAKARQGEPREIDDWSANFLRAQGYNSDFTPLAK